MLLERCLGSNNNNGSIDLPSSNNRGGHDLSAHVDETQWEAGHTTQ